MILFLCLVLLGASAGAQPCDQPWCAYTSMKQIEGVLLDSSSLWAATRGGVLRYDRVERRYDRFTRVDGLAGNRILSLAADDEGDLWFGSDGRGLSRYRTATARFDPPYQEFRGLAITSLLSVGNRLFVGTSSGISLFLVDREEVKETYRLLGDLPKDTAALQMVLLDGKLFAGTSQGVAWARLDQPNLQDPESWRSLPFGSVGGLVVVGGNLYLAGQRSIYAYDPGDDTFRRDYPEGVLSVGARGGQAVAATQEGRLVARNEEGGWSRIPALPIEGVTSISTSEEDVLWLGTSSGLRVIGDSVAVLPSEPGSSRFYEIVVTGEEELWAASVPNDRYPDAGVYHFSQGRWSVHDRSNVVAFETDAEGRLWTGSWGGRRLDPRGDRGLDADPHRGDRPEEQQLAQPEVRARQRHPSRPGGTHVVAQLPRRRRRPRRLSSRARVPLRPAGPGDPPDPRSLPHGYRSRRPEVDGRHEVGPRSARRRRHPLLRRRRSHDRPLPGG